ncbi:MAG: gliding motility-associated C-terminal domain-containing protein [Bacteroidetes bacterium]|nr:gliding motility-associated C-terminal domain-containing protein [Bacteroidota bacterium]
MIKAKKIIFITQFVLLFCVPSAAQFTCPDNLIYGVGQSSFVSVYNPSQPISTNNPSNTTIQIPSTSVPTVVPVLALLPNINGGNPSPTLYSILPNDNFCYWNGSSWVDTGHFSWNGVNGGLAGCHTYLYGFRYFSNGHGEIYRYDGMGQSTLILAFNFPNPIVMVADLVTDCNCNFYLLTSQGLLKYNSNGTLVATYPNVSNGDDGVGMAIIGDTVYVSTFFLQNHYIYKAVISGSQIITTPPQIVNQIPLTSDLASCPRAISQTISTQATINSGTIGCNPNTLNLAVNATLSPLNYNWSGAGIGTSVQGGSVMSVSSAGIYTCTLTQESCDYVLATVVSTVTSNTTVISPQILPASAVCVNASPLFSSITNTAYSYQWHNSASGAVVNSQSIAPNTAGNYTLTVTDVSNGCYGTATASVLAQPQITLGVSSHTMCVYAYDINRIIALTPSGAIHYSIYASSGFTVPVVPSQPIVVQQTQPINAFGGGVGSATLVGSNGVCSASVSVNFSVLPVSALAITPSLITVCKNTKQTFEAVGANVSSYTWQPQYAVTSPHGKKVNVNITAPLTVSLTGTDVFGCGTGVVTAAADVFPDLRGSLLNYADTYCAPFCAAFSFAPAAGSGAAKGAWQIENANYKANSFTHCFKQAGDYVINGILTDSIHGCSNSVSYSVQGYPRPQADFQFTPKQPIENDETVIFTNTSSGVLLDKEAVWFFPNTNLVFGETANFFYKDEGIYPVAMLVRNNYGCTDTAIKAINVLPDFFVYVPNTFTPNNDNLNDAFRAVTRGVKEFKLSVFNRWGAKVFESTDVNQGWDGTYKGEPCKVDVYVWKVTVVSAKEEKKLQGTVMLER